MSHEEALRLVGAHDLAGSGVGWIDVHLLAAARVAGAGLWMADGRLAKMAVRLAIARPRSR